MCYVCIDYIYAKCQVNRFENNFHIVQKLWKCTYVKFSNWFLTKNVIQKDENNTIELPIKFCTKTIIFVAKITALKFSPFFTGITQIHVLNFKLTLTSHLTDFEKNSSEPSRYELLIAAFRVFLRLFFVWVTSAARSAGDPSPARVNTRRHRGWGPGGSMQPPWGFSQITRVKGADHDETFSTLELINFTHTLIILWPWLKWPYLWPTFWDHVWPESQFGVCRLALAARL